MGGQAPHKRSKRGESVCCEMEASLGLHNGQVLGRYPQPMSEANDHWIGRGRFIRKLISVLLVNISCVHHMMEDTISGLS